MAINDNSTVAEARTYIAQNSRDGVDCPCCTRFVKVYRRKLNSAMAQSLIILHNYHARNGWDVWCHLQHYMLNQDQYVGQFPLLRHWGLTEEQEGKREDGNPRTGFYRITEYGRAFARGEVDAPGAVFIFNNKVLSMDEEERTTIHTALGDKFNYAELMNA
jgi:hypothetical protein